MNPYAPPLHAGHGSGAADVRLEGDVLVVSKTGTLPPICLKCGSRDHVGPRVTKFQWTPPYARFSVLFCTILGLILILVKTQRATLGVPLCPPCDARWSAGRNALIGGIVALVGAVVLLRAFDDPTPAFAVFGVVFVGFIVTTFTFVRPRMLQVKTIDDAHVHLRGVHPDAARQVVGLT